MSQEKNQLEFPKQVYQVIEETLPHKFGTYFFLDYTRLNNFDDNQRTKE